MRRRGFTEEQIIGLPRDLKADCATNIPRSLSPHSNPKKTRSKTTAVGPIQAGSHYISHPLEPATLAATQKKASLTLNNQRQRQDLSHKLLTRGTDALSDYELLAILLGASSNTNDIMQLAKSLISRYGSFARVLTAPTEELITDTNIGHYPGSIMKVVYAAALRLMQAEVMEQPVLNNWDRLIGYLTAVLSRERNEQFRVLFLDSKNRLLADEAQARGTVNRTPVYPREVVKRALALDATALILVHNHPSGDPTPSQADIDMTGSVKKAAASVEIVVHDHLIVGNGTWTSFRRAGLL